VWKIFRSPPVVVTILCQEGSEKLSTFCILHILTILIYIIL
jgi:hypothetical protein